MTNTAEKVFTTGIKREDNLMYYVKDGDVWAVPRKQPGGPDGVAVKLVSAGVPMDEAYLYFVDGDGDISRKRRQMG